MFSTFHRLILVEFLDGRLFSSQRFRFTILTTRPDRSGGDITVHNPGTGSFPGEEPGVLAPARALIRCLIRKDVPAPSPWL
jgi:hypothetical protein